MQSETSRELERQIVKLIERAPLADVQDFVQVDVESLYSELSTPKKSIRIVDDEVGKLAVDEIAEILQSLGKG